MLYKGCVSLIHCLYSLKICELLLDKSGLWIALVMVNKNHCKSGHQEWHESAQQQPRNHGETYVHVGIKLVSEFDFKVLKISRTWLSLRTNNYGEKVVLATEKGSNTYNWRKLYAFHVIKQLSRGFSFTAVLISIDWFRKCNWWTTRNYLHRKLWCNRASLQLKISRGSVVRLHVDIFMHGPRHTSIRKTIIDIK